VRLVERAPRGGCIDNFAFCVSGRDRGIVRSIASRRIADDQVAGKVHIDAAVVVRDVVGVDAAAVAEGMNARAVAVGAAVAVAGVMADRASAVHLNSVAVIECYRASGDGGTEAGGDAAAGLPSAGRIRVHILRCRARRDGAIAGNGNAERISRRTRV